MGRTALLASGLEIASGPLFSGESLFALLALTVMEIVLGIDNIVFIAIITGRLPVEKRSFARRVGLFLLDGLTGHVVLIGHDYQDSRSGQNRLAGNSVFIAPGAPVQVLVYEGDAVSGSITGVDAAIDQVSTELGRSWQRNVAADATDVITQLPFANVFLLYSQQGATDGALQALGSMWSAALSDFIGDGGVVVVFDGGGTHAGTYQVLEEAGLLSVTARAALSAQVVTVVAPGDAVAPNVPGSYLGETETVSFTFAGAGTVVVQHGTGPVVIHRTF